MEHAPDHSLESRAVPLLLAIALTMQACGAQVDQVIKKDTVPQTAQAPADNPSTLPSRETTKSPLQQLEETKKDLEAQIIMFKRLIGRLENLQRAKKGGLDNVEAAQLIIARKYLVETGEVLEKVKTQIKLISTVDGILGPEDEDDGSIWEHPNDEELLEE